MQSFSIRRIFQALLIPALAVFYCPGARRRHYADLWRQPAQGVCGAFQRRIWLPPDWAETIRRMTPLILTGLSVAVAFKAGLFNIGASGQFIIGTVCSVAVGVNFEGLPTFIHLPLAILAGIAGGMVWGAIPGLLKVYTGAHEVIVTIMLNYIASLFAGWTVYAGGTQGQTPGPLWDPTARYFRDRRCLCQRQIPGFWPPYRVHYGVALALLAAMFIYWLIFRTTFGFEVRTVGKMRKPPAMPASTCAGSS